MKRIKLSEISLKTFLISSMIFIALVPVIIVGVVSYLNAKSAVTNQLTKSAKNSMNIVNQQVTDLIDREDMALTYLSSAISSQQINRGTMNSINSINTMLEEQGKSVENILSVYVGSSNGSILAQPKRNIPKGFDPRTRPWYTEAMKQPGKLIVTQPYKSIVLRQYVITLARTTKDGKGVVAADLSLNNLVKMNKSIKVGAHGYSMIVSKDKHWISHPTFKIGSRVESSSVTDPLWKSNKASYLGNYKGEVKYYAFTTNKHTGWKIFSSINQLEINANTTPILNTTLIIILIFTAVAILAALFIVAFIAKQIRGLLLISQKLENKDLTTRAAIKGNKEFRLLAQGYNKVLEVFLHLLQSMGNQSRDLAASSEELTASTEESKATSEEIATAMQSIAVSSSGISEQSERMTENVGMINKEVGEISERTVILKNHADQAFSEIVDGKASVKHAMTQMHTIKEISSAIDHALNDLMGQINDIEKINNLINDISEQTQMLSLNAAIEAARAGEDGKGFSVVAEEIRKLAGHSSESTMQVRNTIASVQDKAIQLAETFEKGSEAVSRGLIVVDQTGQSFEVISQSVRVVDEEVNNMVSSVDAINKAIQRVTTGQKQMAQMIDETSANTERVSAAAEQQSASMEQVAASAESLSSMAEKLQLLINQFKTS